MPRFLEYDLVDVSCPKIVPQLFASDQDWDDYEIIDPKSGKETEDQPFAAEAEWDDYGSLDNNAPEEQPAASIPATMNPVQSATARACESTDASVSPLLQEAALLRTRGVRVRMARHRESRKQVVLYRAASQKDYLIVATPSGPRAFEQQQGSCRDIQVKVSPQTLQELLSVIDLFDMLNDYAPESDNA